jgi:hypothetical protein
MDELIESLTDIRRRLILATAATSATLGTLGAATLTVLCV